MSSSLAQANDGAFVHENDSIRVVYDLRGEGGPIRITVHNRLDRPLFVNWHMSSLIIGGNSLPYYNGRTDLQLNELGTSIEWASGISTTSSSLFGSMIRDKSVSFIPPGRHIIAIPMHLKSEFFKFDRTIKPGRKPLTTLTGVAATGRNYVFDPDNSPFQYQSYLTYSADPNFGSMATLKDDFWVSEVMNTMVDPKNNVDWGKQADTFYTTKLTAAGVFMGLVVLAGGLVLSATPE